MEGEIKTKNHDDSVFIYFIYFFTIFKLPNNFEKNIPYELATTQYTLLKALICL